MPKQITTDMHKDPAFPVMVMDILSNVLSCADNPSNLGAYLTEEILGLTGARCVMLIQFIDNKQGTSYRILNVTPARRREWAESLSALHLYEIIHRSPATQLIHSKEQTDISKYLRQEGLDLSMSIPLHLGDLPIGTMLILGLPDKQHISSVLNLLNNLSTVVALVLRNSFLFERQEQIIKERTEELRTVNEQLRCELRERKRVEEDIHRLNEELEQRILDRTVQLEAANKELEAFAYSISHDLRAPLRHIDGFMEMLFKRTAATLDKQSLHYMTTILDAAKRMAMLIDNLLSFSRLGRQELSKADVDLHVLVQEIIGDFELETADRSINWHIHYLPVVSADRTLLRSVMSNLISNALKFTRPRGLGKIEIGTLPDQSSETVIFVRDNGVGFDMTYVGKLFGVFQRLHRADEFEGTGIGLANVRRIIRRHGGQTWAEGAQDQGATFYFSLPSIRYGGTNGRH